MSQTPSSTPLDGLSDFDAKAAHKEQVLSRVRRQREAWRSTRAASSSPASTKAATAAAAAGIAAGVNAAAGLPPEGVSDVGATETLNSTGRGLGSILVGRSTGGFPRSMTMRLITQRPTLAVGLVAVALAVGPARLIRTANMLLPSLLRRF